MDAYSIIIGARPNFVKVAPLLKRARELNIPFQVIHTGQHKDFLMSQSFLDDLEIKVDIFLEFTSLGQTIKELKDLLRGSRGVFVVGDVNSTLAGAVASQGIPLFHIESGLRSGDMRMPEEINRIVVDHLADKLFVTEPSGVENLLSEGISLDKIHETGNLMLENLDNHLEKIKSLTPLYPPKTYFVGTLHRREGNLEENLEILNSLSKPVILPKHPSVKIEKEYKNITIIEPLPYFQFINLVINSSGVVTDSGGIQEETSYLGVPCVTLRKNTERPSTLTGSNTLFTTLEEAEKHLTRDFSPNVWDNKPSLRILETL